MMRAGYWSASMPTSRYNEDNTPLDRALRGGLMKLVGVSAGGFAAETSWVKVYVPRDLSGALELDLRLWARWQPAREATPPPRSLKDDSAPPAVVRAYDAAAEAASGLNFGLSGIGLLAILYLLARR